MTPHSAAPSVSAHDRARAVLSGWQHGQTPDARRALDDDPELRGVKSIVLDLAYEEFCIRKERGEQVRLESFCERFPTYRSSLKKLLEVDQFFGAHPSAVGPEPEGPPRTDRLDDPLATVPLNLARMPLVAPRAQWPEPGDRVDEFVLIDVLGQGSFARVYLARQESAGGRLVALKLSRRADPEAKTLGQLRHPNVVQVHFARQDQDTGFNLVCMEYRGDATLDDLRDRAFPEPNAPPPRRADFLPDVIRQRPELAELRGSAPLSADVGRGNYVDAVVRLAREIAGALATVHAKGVMHRDLKPSNILLDHAGAPVLLDFNLAVSTEGESYRIAGTLPYMAPEQLEAVIGLALPSPATPQTDIFGLGVILYELLGGRLPFGAPEGVKPLAEAARAWLPLLGQGPRPLRELNRSVPRRLEALIHRCLAHDPVKRPASAAEVAAELEHCFTTGRRVRHWARRRFVPLTAVAAVLLAAGTYVAFASTAPRADRHAARAVAAVKEGNLKEAVAAWSEAIRLEPENVHFYRQRAWAYQELQQYDDARSDYQTADKKQPNDPLTLACLGFFEAKLGRHTEAIVFNKKAEEAGFQAGAARNNTGCSRVRLGELEAARLDFEEACKQDPNDPLPFYNLAMTQMRQAMQAGTVPAQQTLECMDRAVELSKGDPGIALGAASLYAYTARIAWLKRPTSEFPLAMLQLGPAAIVPLKPQALAPMVKAIAHLRTAQAGGIHPNRWERNISFVLLEWFPDYNADLPIPERTPPKFVGLRDPLSVAMH